MAFLFYVSCFMKCYILWKIYRNVVHGMQSSRKNGEKIILCMSEEKLKRIEQIKQNWADEVRKIDSDKEVKGLNQEKYNKPYRELEKKYLPLLREAINTNVWL
ncbi:MAG TPA: hypothetical protein DHV96_10370 [Lachnospiraceae bacterium]|nr:hypothetical protein [Lachnospiraceae bacterium]